jgi:hypothetical protein
MATDAIQLLRDHWNEVPEADKETMRRAYTYATSRSRAGFPRSLRFRRVPPLRLRFALPAAAAVCVAAACAVVFTGALSGSGSRYNGKVGNLSGSGGTGSVGQSGEPAHFSPIALNFTRGDQGITSIAVTINAATLGGTAELQVVRGAAAEYVEPGNLAGAQLVFHERVPMTNIASPASGPTGTQALSTWSGTLSPSSWDGGCDNEQYAITVWVHPANPTPEARGEWAESGSFVCSSNSSNSGR